MGNLVTKVLKDAGSFAGAGIGLLGSGVGMVGAGIGYGAKKVIKGADRVLDGVAEGVVKGATLDFSGEKMVQREINRNAAKFDRHYNTKKYAKSTIANENFSGPMPTKMLQEFKDDVAKNYDSFLSKVDTDGDDLPDYEEFVKKSMDDVAFHGFSGLDFAESHPIASLGIAAGIAYGGYQMFSDDEEEY